MRSGFGSEGVFGDPVCQSIFPQGGKNEEEAKEAAEALYQQAASGTMKLRDSQEQVAALVEVLGKYDN